MRARHFAFFAVPAVAVLALTAIPPAFQASAADAKIAVTQLAGDRRSVTISAFGVVAFPADTFSAEIFINSGSQTVDATEPKLSALVDKVQTLLSQASLPAAEMAADSTSTQNSAVGKVVVSREYVVHVDSWNAAQQVRRTLATITDTRGGFSENAVVSLVQVDSRNAKLAADPDPDAGQTAARKKALQKAQADAAKCAEVFGMKVGQPINISEITSSGVQTTGTTQGFSASCTVTFELIP